MVLKNCTGQMRMRKKVQLRLKDCSSKLNTSLRVERNMADNETDRDVWKTATEFCRDSYLLRMRQERGSKRSASGDKK